MTRSKDFDNADAQDQELDLKAETVKDLESDAASAEEIRGGACPTGTGTCFEGCSGTGPGYR